jgi:hypothetical protein
LGDLIIVRVAEHDRLHSIECAGEHLHTKLILILGDEESRCDFSRRTGCERLGASRIFTFHHSALG